MAAATKDVEWLSRSTAEYRSSKDDAMGMVEDLDELGKLGQDFSSMDDLEKVDIGDGVVPRPTYVSARLNTSQKWEIIELLKAYMCCFAWDYTEMPRLSRELVEHRLPIKASFRLYKLGAQNFKPEIIRRVKEEVDPLLQARFIQPCRYVDWVSNIVLVEKKNTRKIRICVDFRNLNQATPKDEYPMPIPDLLVDSMSGNKVISFLDGIAGYNQIFMAKKDVSKTAFCYPGFIGLFEWVVMTFDLKNVGAMYQRAMNLIFHDLLGVLMEVYIDDVVVKSVGFKEHMIDLKLLLETMKKYGLYMNPLKCTFGVTSGRFLGFVVHKHGIQIDPNKIESIGKIGESVCKKDIQKLLSKINYLCHFISNIVGQVESLLKLIQLKHEEEFTWGQNSEKLSRRSNNTSCLHSCCELRRSGTRSRCILPCKNGLLELFYYKKKMARSF
jgi:hypothetical protein